MLCLGSSTCLGWLIRFLSVYRLTAFVAKSFAQARAFIPEYIDDKLLEDSLEWMARLTNRDGSFQKVGAVHSTGLKVCYLILSRVSPLLVIGVATISFPYSTIASRFKDDHKFRKWLQVNVMLHLAQISKSTSLLAIKETEYTPSVPYFNSPDRKDVFIFMHGLILAPVHRLYFIDHVWNELVLYSGTGHGNESLKTSAGEVTLSFDCLVFQGGQTGSISLTAYVLIALAEANSKSEVSCNRIWGWGGGVGLEGARRGDEEGEEEENVSKAIDTAQGCGCMKITGSPKARNREILGT